MNYKRFLGAASAALMIIVAIFVLASAAGAQVKYKTLHRFTGGKDGNAPYAGLVFDAAGNLYGTTYLGGAHGYGTVFKLTHNPNGTWTESVLHSFAGGAEGSYPYAAVIFDAAGNLYGTASDGIPYGPGAVFKLTPNADGTWTETVIHAFTDGDLPLSPLVFDAQGNLYGTTDWSNWGFVYKLTPNSDGTWTESLPYSFKGPPDDGGHPQTSMIFDAAGNMYGTTFWGGSGKCVTNGCGTVFKLSPNSDRTWTESVLHSFAGDRDGANPPESLVFDALGNLYGATVYGTYYQSCGNKMCGTVFELTPNSDGTWTENILHGFTGGKDGGNPNGYLVFDAAGNLYGTAGSGGAGYGVVFKLTPNSNGGWKETVLHGFKDTPGAYPSSGLIFDGAGNLYGTTVGDGAKTFGSVFEITP